jgi:type II secretory pathway pseudopilin PulG
VGLLAILATLAVIALLAGLTIPYWFGRHEVTLDNAARLLARDLQAVQNRTAFLGEPARVRFHEHGWEATDSAGEVLTRYGGEEPFARRLDADAVFEGVTLQAIAFGDDAALDLGTHGEPLEEGSLVVTFRGERRLVRVTLPHGEVLIEGLARGPAGEGN